MSDSDRQYRIGIDARFILRPQRGMPHYVLKICEWLPRLQPDWAFHLFTNTGYEHNEARASWEPRISHLERLPNVTIVDESSSGDVYWEQVLLPRLIRKFHIQLIHLPANRAILRPRAPMICTLHDVMEYKFIEKIIPIPETASLKEAFYQWRRRLYVKLIYRHGFKRATHIITVSRCSATDIGNTLKIGDQAITPIHHGLDEEFTPVKDLPLQDREFVLMMGGDSYQKNPEGALKAWSLVPPSVRKRFPLKIIGFTGQESSPLLKAVRENDLTEEVTIKRWVSREDLVAHFRHAALFIFLSRSEGFGFPVQQAMACGVPTVHSTHEALTEVSDGACVACPAEDHEGAAAAISELLNDHAYWKTTSEKCIERARVFSWETCAQEHLSILKNVLAPAECQPA